VPLGLKKNLFRSLEILETGAARLLGKGWGAGSIDAEIKQALGVIKPARPQLAIDVGANVGDYTAGLIRRFPDLEIHVFEPSSKNSETLLNRFSKNQKVSVVSSGLSDKTGDADLYGDKDGSGLSSLSQRRLDHFGLNFDFLETVKTLRFEEYWKLELGKREIDLVKIDVEGHELRVLDGFGEAVNHVKVIQFEFGGCNIDSRTFFQDFWYWMRDREFRLARITPLGLQVISSYRESDEFFRTTNYLAISEKNSEALL
jgi:FkbM family methyltransferase